MYRTNTVQGPFKSCNINVILAFEVAKCTTTFVRHSFILIDLSSPLKTPININQ